MDITAVIGLVAGCGTSLSSLPQLVKIWRDKHSDDVSKLMLYVLIVGVALWVVYGFLKHDWPIIIANSVSLVINIATTILRFKYSRR